MSSRFFKTPFSEVYMASDVFHPFPPVFCESSSVLILGSFPSVRSRGEGFYYGHPRHRFWRVIAGIFGEDVPCGTEAPGFSARSPYRAVGRCRLLRNRRLGGFIHKPCRGKRYRSDTRPRGHKSGIHKRRCRASAVPKAHLSGIRSRGRPPALHESRQRQHIGSSADSTVDVRARRGHGNITQKDRRTRCGSPFDFCDFYQTRRERTRPSGVATAVCAVHSLCAAFSCRSFSAFILAVTAMRSTISNTARSSSLPSE